MWGVDAICGTKQRQNVRDGVFLTFENATGAKSAKIL